MKSKLMTDGEFPPAFALTLAANGASVIPMYLTKPLLDNVLIPHQESPDLPVNTCWPVTSA
jgi:hypothetical protein